MKKYENLDNFKIKTHTIEVLLQIGEYKGKIRRKVRGNMIGLDILDCIDDETIYDMDEFEKIDCKIKLLGEDNEGYEWFSYVFKNDKGETCESSDLYHEFVNMIVGINIVDCTVDCTIEEKEESRQIIKHCVEFFYPGILFPETRNEEVKNRNKEEVVIPKGSYGFRFFDIEEYKTKSGSYLQSDKINISPCYYRGKKMTVDDVIKELPDKDILINNMKNNDIEHIVWAEHNQAIPLHEGDEIL